LLHSLRYLIGDDAFWRATRRLVYGTVNPEQLSAPIVPRYRTTDDFMRIAAEEAGEDLGWFFEVYARRGPLPVLELSETEDGILLEWHAPDALPFPMPIPVRFNGKILHVEFENNKAVLHGIARRDVLVDPYMRVLRKLPIVPTCEERRAEEAEKEES